MACRIAGGAACSALILKAWYSPSERVSGGGG